MVNFGKWTAAGLLSRGAQRVLAERIPEARRAAYHPISRSYDLAVEKAAAAYELAKAEARLAHDNAQQQWETDLTSRLGSIIEEPRDAGAEPDILRLLAAI